MSRANNIYKDKYQSGMTLIEILVSLVILLLVLMAIFPLLSQSFKVTNLSHAIAANIFQDQEEIEVIAATKGGILFADGTFIPQKYFPVFFPGISDPVEVLGMTVKKNKLVRFLASIPHIKTTTLYEGYTADEAIITINGYNTHFIDENAAFADPDSHPTEIEITDKEGNLVNTYTDYDVVNDHTVKVTMPLDDTRLTNLYSPYTITLTTGNEITSTLLPVNLPRAVAVGEDHSVLVSSDGMHWVAKDSAGLPTETINKLVFKGQRENNAAFLAVGNNGSIYIWPNGENWQRIDHNLTSQHLHDIVLVEDQLIAVGNGGVILTSNNGNTWCKVAANTAQDLHAANYFAKEHKYICTGNGGVILTSSNGTSWTKQHTWPRMANAGINNKKAVRFSGEGEYLKTISAPVTADTVRTAFIAAAPEDNADTLISWGSPLGEVAGGRFTLRLDQSDAGKFRLEQGQGVFFKSDFTSSSGEPALYICRSDSGDFSSYRLYKNGDPYQPASMSGSIMTSSRFPAQLGSDPLTRYTGPLPFKGLIAEVLIYDQAVNDTRSAVEGEPDKYHASALDLVKKYFSDKYDLGITFPDNLIVNGEPLNTTIIDETFLPDGMVLWLDASNLELDNDKQVICWNDRSPSNNHAAGSPLLALACSQNKIIGGGYHRNLLNSDNTSEYLQNSSLNSDYKTAEFRIDDIVYTIDKFLALANDGLGTSSKNKSFIMAADDNLIWTTQLASNSILNDIDFCPGTGILTVGNNTTIYFSDNGTDWSPADVTGIPDTDLKACVIRD